jgi:hypothetical protein
MSRKSPKYPVNPKDFQEIEDMGYLVKQFSEYHYRISKEEGEFSLDIWPTSRKYSTSPIDGPMSRSKEYKDLIKLVELTLK